MYNISNSDELIRAITLLEEEVEGQKILINEQMNILYQSYRPVNVVRDVFKEVATSEEFRENILTAILGMSTGYLTKKLFFSKSSNVLKLLSGNLVQYGIANFLMHPSRTLKSIFLPLIGLLLKNDKKKPVKVHEAPAGEAL